MSYREKLTDHFKGIVDVLKEMGHNTELDISNFEGTPERAARALLEVIKPRQDVINTVTECVRKTFDSRSHEGMVVAKDITAFSLCPHHLLPVTYNVTVGYIPSPDEPKVIGLSKIPRIIKAFSSSPVLQETLTENIVDAFYSGHRTEASYKISQPNDEIPPLHTLGAGCVTVGKHMCVACRGVGAWESSFVYAAMRGMFFTNTRTRGEFMKYVGSTQ